MQIGPIIDVPADEAVRTGASMIVGAVAIALVGLGLLACVVSSIPFAAAALVTGALVVGSITAGVAYVRRSSARVVSLLARTSTLDEFANKARAPWVARILIARQRSVRAVARALLAGGRAGTIIRIGRSKLFRPVRPLEYPIEPSPLDESDAGVCAVLEALRSEADAAAPEPGGTVASGDPPAPLQRRWRRFTKHVGGPFIIVCWLILATRSAWHSWQTGRPSIALLLWVALIGLSVLAGLFSWGGRYDQLAVNGGLLCRGRGWARLFVPDDSVVIATRESGSKTWVVTIVDDESVAEIRVTDDELEFFLSAWSSPLSPPPVERLAELAT